MVQEYTGKVIPLSESPITVSEYTGPVIPLEQLQEEDQDERAQPGSLSYIAQGAPSGVETLIRMIGSMAGMGGGALVGGVESMLPESISGVRPAADIIRERMEQGAAIPTRITEAALGRPTAFAPTQPLEEAAGAGFEAIREGMGTGMELQERLRQAGPARFVETPEQQEKYAAGARTAGEYAFDAPIATALPYAALKGATKAALRREFNKPGKEPLAGGEEVPSLKSPTPSPKDIIDRAIEGADEYAIARIPESKAIPFEIPDVPGERPVSAETVATGEAVRRFQQEGYVREPITVGQRAQEATSDAIREFHQKQRGPGGKQIGAIIPSTPTPRKPPAGPKTKLEEYLDIDRGMGKYVPDLIRPLEDVVNETLQIGKDINQKQGRDIFIKYQNDLGDFTKYWLNPEHIAEFTAEKMPILKAVIDRVIEKKRYHAGVREEFLKGAEMAWETASPFQKARIAIASGGTALRYIKRRRAGYIGLVEKLNIQGQLDFFKLRKNFENADILKETGSQWPTEKQLREAGASPDVVAAYLKETEYVDAAYKYVNKARAWTGLDPIEQIPGYFPHTYKGHQGVKVFGKITTAKGLVEEFPIYYTKTSGSTKKIRQVADSIIADVGQKWAAENPETPISLRAEVRRTDHPNSGADVLDALETVSQIYTNTDKPIVKLMHKMLDKQMTRLEQQFLQSALERSGLEGWIGSEGISRANLKDLLERRANWMDSVLKYVENQDIFRTIQGEISTPAWNQLGTRLPNVQDYITKFVDVARSKVPLKEIDNVWLDFFSKWTGDRFAYRTPLVGIHKLRGFYSIKDLSWSASFHASNAIQPEMFGSAALYRMWSNTGKGDPMTAMLKSDWQQFSMSRENREALDWAAKHKVITSRLMEAIDFMSREEMVGIKGFPGKAAEYVKQVVTGRKPAELNEAMGRLRTFLMGLEYYRSAGLKEPIARQAAAKFTDNVMVDYSSSGLPLWLAHNPLGTSAGRFLSQYAGFRHSFWGHTILAYQALKNNPGMARKLLPVIQLQMATATFAGLRGMITFAELTALSTLFNEAWEAATNEPGPFPNPISILLSSKIGQSDTAVFGALSASTKAIPGLEHGVDIGQTATSPQASESITVRPLTGFIRDTAAIFKILKTESSDSDKVNALKAIAPSWIHGQIELAFRKDAHMSFDEHNRMRGNVLRDPEDWRARLWTGKRSLTEQRQLQAKQISQREEVRVKELKSDITEIATDFYEREGYIKQEHIDLAAQQGYRGREFRDRVRDLIDERHQTRLGRMTRGKKRTQTRERVRARTEELLQGAEY